MKYNKSTDTYCSYCHLRSVNVKKILKKTLFVSAGLRWKTRTKTADSGSTISQNLPNPKNKFPAKFIFTSSIFVLLLTDKKAKTISLKVFKITDFKNLQQETAKGTLRPSVWMFCYQKLKKTIKITFMKEP